MQNAKCKMQNANRGPCAASPQSPIPNPQSPFHPVADSKRLYQSGNGLGRLERGVLALLGTMGHRPGTWCEAWTALDGGAGEQFAVDPVVRRLQRAPPAGGGHRPRVGRGRLRSGDGQPGPGLAAAGVRLVALRSRAIFAGRFNELLAAVRRRGRSCRTRRSVCWPTRSSRSATARSGSSATSTAAQQLPRFARRGISRQPDRDRRRGGASRASTASARPSGGSKSASSPRPSGTCLPRWPRWCQSTFANWRCGPSTASGAARCRALRRRPATRWTPAAIRTAIADAQTRLGISDRVLWREK